MDEESFVWRVGGESVDGEDGHESACGAGDEDFAGGSDEVCGEHVCILDDVETEFLCGV